MVSIFYKWFLDDGLFGNNGADSLEDKLEEAEEELEDAENGHHVNDENRVCIISNIPFLRKLTENLPPEPAEDESPFPMKGD